MTNPLCSQIRSWHSQLTPTLAILRNLAGNTEEQFLKLGESLQDFAIRSARISDLAQDLVQLVAGSESIQLTARLQRLFVDMNDYLGRVNNQGSESCRTLEQIMTQLDNVVRPLEGFQKMDKALRMLSISTKIESARLGELGAGFTTLAMDVEKLSQVVSEKSAGIMMQRQSLIHLISSNLVMVSSTEEHQYADAARILTTVGENLQTLTKLNTNCSETGSQVKMTSELISADMGAVVSSMQFHDITRQQIEHVIEALERMQQHIISSPDEKDDACHSQIAEIGDICELQTAQMRHAAEQLSQATITILDSLRDIGSKQAQISFDLQQALMGSSNSTETSLLDSMEQEMHQVAKILQSCDKADQELSGAMSKVTGTITEIGSFVSDIEAVGSEIDLIALNAQIKAAHTGPQGAALGVLAEAIKRLSLDAVTQTEAVSSTLVAINSITATMADQNYLSSADSDSLKVADMEQEAGQIISALSTINRTLLQQLSGLANSAESLADDISSTTANVHVHEDIKQQTEHAVQALELIDSEARILVPASSEFRDNLRHMEQRYTMESERMIHEMMAARHGVKISLQKQHENSGSDSEYGDNVDLF
jgi:methyl-accepting chemotaxis protein